TLSQAGMVRHLLKERDKKPNTKILKRKTSEADAKRPLPDVELANEEEHRSHFFNYEVTAPAGWKKTIVINNIGALATSVVLIVFILTKFVHGAWIVVVVTPLLVLMFRAIHEHYLSVARQLTTEGLEPLQTINHTVIVPISGIHRGVVSALQYAKSI